MKIKQLENLVKSGNISGYELVDLDEDGDVGCKSKCRNTQRLTIIFPDKNRLVIGTFCSGCCENTEFEFCEFGAK